MSFNNFFASFSNNNGSIPYSRGMIKNSEVINTNGVLNPNITLTFKEKIFNFQNINSNIQYNTTLEFNQYYGGEENFTINNAVSNFQDNSFSINFSNINSVILQDGTNIPVNISGFMRGLLSPDQKQLTVSNLAIDINGLDNTSENYYRETQSASNLKFINNNDF